MATNAQTIKQFNQNNQQAANQPATPTSPTPTAPAPQGGGNPPAAPTKAAPQAQGVRVKLHSSMSASDIALLQKDPATLTKGEAVRRKALETREVLREQEEEQERRRQVQVEADKARGRFDRVAISEAARGVKAFGDTTLKPRSWIMRAPTVGGIGALLGLIILFLLAIMPVDKQGNTRLFLIWLTLTGKTSLKLQQNGPGSNIDNNSNSNSNNNSNQVVSENPQPKNIVLPDVTTQTQDQTPTFTLPPIFTNGTANLLDLFG